MENGRNGRARGRFGLLPQTARGRWAARLLGAGVALLGATTLLANVDGLGGTGWLAVTAVPALLAMLGGGIIGGVAVVRDGERSGIALVPVLVGVALAWLLIGEIVMPH